MNPTKTKKKFDCIAFKEEAQARIYEEIKDLSRQEQVDYFNAYVESGPLAEWWKKVVRGGGKQ